MRQIIVNKINKPKTGTIICIPIVNMFGFVNKSREFPDGRDLNRVFPGSQKGSLASRFAFHILKEIMPIVDYAIDFQKDVTTYTVVNLLGQTLLQGKLTSNNLDISSLPMGAFFIKIGEAQSKFFKQ